MSRDSSMINLLSDKVNAKPRLTAKKSSDVANRFIVTTALDALDFHKPVLVKADNTDVLAMCLITCQRILQNIGKVLSFLQRNTSAKICLSKPMRNKLNRNIDAKLAEIENEIYGIPQLYSVKRITIANIYGIKSFVDETVSKQKHSQDMEKDDYTLN